METVGRRSFWLETTPTPQPRPQCEGSVRAEVAIIGGGFAGLSTAYHIKRLAPGTRVTVLEAETVGYGASGRNGGFSMTVFGASLTVTHTLHGPTRTREAYQYMTDAVDYVDRLVSDAGLACDYERSGFLRTATTPGYRKRILREMELASKIGVTGVEWWDQDDVQEAVRSPLFLGGWWEPRCALLHPAKFVRELQRIAEQAGVTLYEHSPVVEVTQLPRGFRIRTPNALISAEKVVFATNAWSHRIAPVARRQIPAWTYLIATEPLGQSVWESLRWRQRMGIEDARNLIHYFRPSPDGRVLMGGGPILLGYGTHMGYDHSPGAFRHLQEFLVHIFPQLREVGIEYRWGGPFSVTLDLVPAIGYAAGRDAVYMLGCIGHGVALMPGNGRIAADLVLERQTPLTELWFVNRRLQGWPGEPVRRVISTAVRGVMSLEDSWHERAGLGERRSVRQAPETR
jgi:glycine/D-amino acid oxidase-like deaminating enzyme